MTLIEIVWYCCHLQTLFNLRKVIFSTDRTALHIVTKCLMCQTRYVQTSRKTAVNLPLTGCQKPEAHGSTARQSVLSEPLKKSWNSGWCQGDLKSFVKSYCILFVCWTNFHQFIWNSAYWFKSCFSKCSTWLRWMSEFTFMVAQFSPGSVSNPCGVAISH